MHSKTRQKSIIFLLVLSLCLALIGCGKQQEPSDSPTEPQSDSQSTATDPPTTTSTENIPSGETSLHFTTGEDLPLPGSTSPGETTGSSSPATSVTTTTGLFPLADISMRTTNLSASASGRVVATAALSVPYIDNPTGSKAIDAMNSAISRVLDEKKEYFNNTLSPLAKEAHALGVLNRECSISMTYEIALNSRTVLSIVFFVQVCDDTPNPYLEKFTLNFGYPGGGELTLDSVFKVSSDVYLDKIYNYILGIMQNDGVNYHPDYANLLKIPDLENRWYFDQNGMTFVFGLYELATYAAGLPTYTIPYAEISSMLSFNPRY